VWAFRRLLLRDGRRLSGRQWARLTSLFATDDPTGGILAAWAGRECLRQLLDHVDVPELTRLATTIETWWPEALAFLQRRITNIRTEGYNRMINTIKRAGRGYRDQADYERRILLHKRRQSRRDQQTPRGRFHGLPRAALPDRASE
jgi:transposase